jgi:hypothetical protein
MASLWGFQGGGGERGPRGFPGVPGPQGLPGANGVNGEKGDKGDTGDEGPTGPQGAPGFSAGTFRFPHPDTFTSSVLRGDLALTPFDDGTPTYEWTALTSPKTLIAQFIGPLESVALLSGIWQLTQNYTLALGSATFVKLWLEVFDTDEFGGDFTLIADGEDTATLLLDDNTDADLTLAVFTPFYEFADTTTRYATLNLYAEADDTTSLTFNFGVGLLNRVFTTLLFAVPQGPQGPQGEKGDKGDKGDQGDQGDQGDPGVPGQNGVADPTLPFEFQNTLGVVGANNAVKFVVRRANGNPVVYADTGNDRWITQGSSVFNGNVLMNENLQVLGQATAGSLQVGNVTLQQLTIAGNVRVEGADNANKFTLADNAGSDLFRLDTSLREVRSFGFTRVEGGNSTNKFRVLTSGGASTFRVNTTNQRIFVEGANSAPKFVVKSATDEDDFAVDTLNSVTRVGKSLEVGSGADEFKFVVKSADGTTNLFQVDTRTPTPIINLRASTFISGGTVFSVSPVDVAAKLSVTSLSPLADAFSVSNTTGGFNVLNVSSLTNSESVSIVRAFRVFPSTSPTSNPLLEVLQGSQGIQVGPNTPATLQASLAQRSGFLLAPVDTNTSNLSMTGTFKVDGVLAGTAFSTYRHVFPIGLDCNTFYPGPGSGPGDVLEPAPSGNGNPSPIVDQYATLTQGPFQLVVNAAQGRPRVLEVNVLKSGRSYPVQGGYPLIVDGQGLVWVQYQVLPFTATDVQFLLLFPSKLAFRNDEIDNSAYKITAPSPPALVIETDVEIELIWEQRPVLTLP